MVKDGMPMAKKKTWKTADICPNCGNNYLTADSFKTEGDVAYRVIICDSCHTKWREVFKFAFCEEID
jgi:formate dehydrogenase maturation protein FdhE